MLTTYTRKYTTPSSPSHESKAVDKAVVILKKKISLLFCICVFSMKLLVQWLMHINLYLLKSENHLIQKTSKYRCLWGRSFHSKGSATKPIRVKGSMPILLHDQILCQLYLQKKG